MSLSRSGARSPVHVHVAKDTPVHVHLKGKKGKTGTTLTKVNRICYLFAFTQSLTVKALTKEMRLNPFFAIITVYCIFYFDSSNFISTSINPTPTGGSKVPAALDIWILNPNSIILNSSNFSSFLR